MPKLNHLHTYEQVKGKKDIFRCIHPDCSHYCNKNLLEGKRATCPHCGIPFILTNDSFRRKKPHCVGCTNENIANARRKEPKVEEYISIDESKLLANLDDFFKK